MKKVYFDPEVEIRKFDKASSIWTSGPTDLNDGDDFDPDADDSSAAKNYFYKG